MSKHLLAIDIGGSKVAVLARELRNDREVYRAKVPTPKGAGVDEMLRLIDLQIGSIPGGRASLRALGVSSSTRARRITGEEMRAGDVVRHAGGQGRLAGVANDVVDHLAGSVLAISTLLDPEAIVFGGGTSAAGRVLLREIRRRLRPHGMKTRLLLSRLGTEAQLYGALGGAERVARAKRPSRRKQV